MLRLVIFNFLPLEHNVYRVLFLSVNQTSYPRKSDTSNGIGQHATEDGREGIAGGKVGVEAGMLPMCHLDMTMVTCL